MRRINGGGEDLTVSRQYGGVNWPGGCWAGYQIRRFVCKGVGFTHAFNEVGDDHNRRDIRNNGVESVRVSFIVVPECRRYVLLFGDRL